MINKFFIRDSITRCLRLVSFPQGKVLRMNTLITIFIILFTEHFVSFEHGLLFLNLVTRQAFPVLNSATSICRGTVFVWFIGTKYLNVSYYDSNSYFTADMLLYMNCNSRPDRLREIADRFNLDQNAMLDNVLYCRAYTSRWHYIGHLVSALSACQSATTIITIYTSLLQIICWQYK